MLLPGRLSRDYKRGKARRPDAGTPLATYTSSKSGTADCETAPVSTWGGARNRANRVSHELTAAQVAATIDAAATAWARGMPFNRHITIHWERAGVPDSRAAVATGAFLKLVRQFLRSRGERFAYVWVRENDAGDGSKGSHVHILAYVRPDAAAAFTAMQRRWLRRVTGRAYRAGVIRTARIGGRLRTATAAPEVYRANLAAIVAYVLKGALPDATRARDLVRYSDGGRIIGKRVGRSQNVSV